MLTRQSGNDLIIYDEDCFDIALTLDCGQAFRWSCDERGVWSGAAGGRFLKLKQTGGEITLFDTSAEEFENFWRAYFDLDRDYSAIIASYDDKSLVQACGEYRGIRILRQDGWEAVCSFIISANNNIPRIKGIIARLCENYGEKIADGVYSFPSAERIAALELADLNVLRAGFRNKYILDAARKIASGEVSLAKVETADFDSAKAELLKIKGVGEKVAQCALLYGFGRVEAFPIDVWVKRIVAELYPDGLPACIRGTEGIAQQYLFHWRRNLDK